MGPGFIALGLAALVLGGVALVRREEERKIRFGNLPNGTVVFSRTRREPLGFVIVERVVRAGGVVTYLTRARNIFVGNAGGIGEIVEIPATDISSALAPGER